MGKELGTRQTKKATFQFYLFPSRHFSLQKSNSHQLYTTIYEISKQLNGPRVKKNWSKQNFQIFFQPVQILLTKTPKTIWVFDCKRKRITISQKLRTLQPCCIGIVTEIFHRERYRCWSATIFTIRADYLLIQWNIHMKWESNLNWKLRIKKKLVYDV